MYKRRVREKSNNFKLLFLALLFFLFGSIISASVSYYYFEIHSTTEFVKSDDSTNVESESTNNEVNKYQYYSVNNYTPADQGYLDYRTKQIAESNKSIENSDYTLLIGDSITKRVDQYPEIKLDNCVNVGVPGATSYDIVNYFDDIYFTLDTSKISTVYITLGVNDSIIQDQNLTYNSSFTANNINILVSRIYQDNPNIKIYVVSPFPSRLGMDISTPTSNEFIDDVVGAIYFSLDEHASYININKDLKGEDGQMITEYSKDGLHLTKLGYETVIDLIKENS